MKKIPLRFLIYVYILAVIPSIIITAFLFLKPILTYHSIAQGYIDEPSLALKLPGHVPAGYVPSFRELIDTATIVYTNIWHGGHLIDTGHISTLWNNKEFGQTFWDHISHFFGENVWSYPPSYMLVAALIGLFPLLLSYAIWQVANIGFARYCMGKTGLPMWVVWFGLVFSPSSMTNIRAGHNGSLFGMFLFLGMYFLALGLSNKEKITGLWSKEKISYGFKRLNDTVVESHITPQAYQYLAGIMFGMLFMKPPFAIIVPFILFGMKGWKTLASTIATVVSIFVLTLICFGWISWVEFFKVTSPTMSAFLQRPWHADGLQVDFVNPLIAYVSTGLSYHVAWILQGITSLICAVVTYKIWASNRNEWDKIFITLPLLILITPYAHDYDMVICGLTSTFLAYSLATGFRCNVEQYKMRIIYLILTLFAASLPGWGAFICYNPSLQALAARLPFVETLNMAIISFIAYKNSK